MFVGENKWNVRSETICEFVLFLWFYSLYFGILFYDWVYECSSTILTVLTRAIPLDHAHIAPWPRRLKADITSLSFTPFLSRLQLGEGGEFLLANWSWRKLADLVLTWRVGDIFNHQEKVFSWSLWYWWWNKQSPRFDNLCGSHL